MMDWNSTKNLDTPRSRWASQKSGGHGDNTPINSRVAALREDEPSNHIAALPRQVESGPMEVVPRNPFEATLLEQLHRPTISPNVFSRIVSPSQDTGHFSWSIDDVATLRPAPIEEFPLRQQECILDTEQEARAQEVIDNYFRRHAIVPSPCTWVSHTKQEEKYSSSPSIPTPVASKNFVCASTQTILSFPHNLPSQLSEALNAVLSAIEAWENGDCDSSYIAPSLRRKLHFHEDSDEAVSSMADSPECKTDSPYQMLIPSTPKEHERGYRREVEISPPEMSPISKDTDQYRPPSAQDFTVNMSIDYPDASQSRMSKHMDGTKKDTGYQTCSSCSTRLDNCTC